MSAINIYSLNDVVSFSMAGWDAKMGVAQVMDVFQLALSNHTDIMGIGSEKILSSYNAKWIITKIRFEFDRFLNYGEKMTVTTWPLKPGALRFNRAYTLTDGTGECITRAFSDWCIIDADTSRILNTSTLENPISEYKTQRATESGYSNVKLEISEQDFCYEKTMRQSDLDLNRHVNNISYIRMAMDCFSSKELENTEIKTFEIHYKRQCFEGENIRLYKVEDGHGYFITGLSNGKSVFTATVNK